jgi:hypothetical protein
LSIFLFATVAAAAVGGCREEPSEPRTAVSAPSLQPGPQPQSSRAKRDVAKTIDFAADFVLKDVCGGTLQEARFKKFESYDFIYDSGLPVRVSGSYLEVLAKGAGSASTIYDEVEATIFRDIEIEVEAEADDIMPHFSFSRKEKPFAVSDHPFSAHRQLRHQRAMGSPFPFLDLAKIPFHEADEVDLSHRGGPNFSRNFISVLNFLASRGENSWGISNSFDEREKARQLRIATTGTKYERPQSISGAALGVLRNIPASEKLSVDYAGDYIVVYLGKPAKVVAAIGTEEDVVGFTACTRSD